MNTWTNAYRSVSLAALLAGAAAAGGCSEPEDNEGTNTNWIHCETATDCAALGAAAVCVAGRCQAANGDSGGPDTGNTTDARPDAGDGAVPDAAVVCRAADPAPCAVDDPACFHTFATAEKAVGDCYDLTAGGVQAYVMRCGDLDVIVNAGTDSSSSYYYDATGRVVGSDHSMPGSIECESYSSSFVALPSPLVCTITTPKCVPDAGVAPDAGRCKIEQGPPPCDAFRPECGISLSEARTLVPPCRDRWSGWSEKRCGTYVGIETRGIDSGDVYYYDEATGKLVGVNRWGLTSFPGCTGFDPSFTDAPFCEDVTPVCLPDGGVPADAGGDSAASFDAPAE